MFKEEIKQLAAWQGAERRRRVEMKASDAPRTLPVLGPPPWSREQLAEHQEAWKAVAPYHTAFYASDKNKRERRLAIRIRHLIEGFRGGMPYRMLEAKTDTEAVHLHLLMVTLDPTLDQAALRTWLEVKYSHSLSPSCHWGHNYRLTSFAASGAWMTLPDRLRQKTA